MCLFLFLFFGTSSIPGCVFKTILGHKITLIKQISRFVIVVYINLGIKLTIGIENLMSFKNLSYSSFSL